MAEIFKSDTRPFVSFKKEVSMSSGLSSSEYGTVAELWLSVLFVCFLFTSLFFEVILWLKLLSKVFFFSFLSFLFSFFFRFRFHSFILFCYFILFLFQPNSLMFNILRSHQKTKNGFLLKCN